MLNDFLFKTFNYLRTSLGPEHFWDAASALANSCMVLATFLLLRETVKSERNRNRREFIGEVVTPVLAQLNGVESFLRSSPSIIGRQTIYNFWQWKGVRVNAGSIIYFPDKKIVQKIDDYDQQLIKFDNFFTQQIEVYAGLVKKDFRENVMPNLNLLVTSGDYLDEDFIMTFPYTAECRITMGGKYSTVSLFQLAVLNITFKEYFNILEKDPGIPNTEISYKVFMVEGLVREGIDEEVFNGISRRIKEQNIENPKLKIFTIEYKRIINRTEALRKFLREL